MGLMLGSKKASQEEYVKREEPPVKAIESVSKAKATAIVSQGMRVTGNVAVEEPVEIYGKIEGDVSAKSSVLLRGGEITGKVVAESLLVKGGRILGPVEVALGMEVSEEGKVNGDVSAKRLAVDSNALVCGNVKAEEIIIGSRGGITGNIEALTLKTESGCTINGLVKMQNKMDDIIAQLDQADDEVEEEIPAL